MAGNTPLVSIIMPVHDGEKYLKQALESLFRDAYRPMEVIVVDDGSSDNSAQISRQYADVRYVFQANEGVAAARNKGIALSRGEIIAFLDCDDIWLPNRLTVTVDFFQQHPETGYILGKQMMFVEPGCDVPSWVKPEWLKEPQDASNTAVLAVRRTTFDRVGLFNKEIVGEDTEWLVRASETGVQKARLPEVVLHKRIHGGNLSVQMFKTRKTNLLKIARESVRRQEIRKKNIVTENKDHLVSVIIAVYNGETHLAETIESVIQQTYPNIEIIIIDDGSTDKSRKVALQYVPPARYHYQSNSGIASAWNQGIELARGDFIAFNGADDLWDKNKIRRQLDVFIEDAALDVVFSHVKQFHSPELTDEERRRIKCPHTLMPGISAGTMLIKRESLFRVGVFNTRWRRGIFNDWYLRATELGIRTHMLPDLLMWRRLHRSNHGIVNREKSVDYVRMLKAALDRRRTKISDSA